MALKAISAVNTCRKLIAVWLICVMEQPDLVLNVGRRSLKASRTGHEAYLDSLEGLLHIRSEESNLALPDIETAMAAVLSALASRPPIVTPLVRMCTCG